MYITFTGINYSLLGSEINYFDILYLHNSNTFAMLPLTVISIVMLSIAQILLIKENNKLVIFGQALNFGIVTIASIVLLDYFFNSIITQSLHFNNTMSVYTAFIIIVYGISNALLQPNIGIIQLFTRMENGYLMAKQLYLRLFVIMIIITYVRLLILRENLVSLTFGVILYLVSFLIVALLLIWKAANELNKIQVEKLAIEESLDFQHTLLEATPDPMIVVDKEGIIRMMNTQIKTVFGYNKDEIIGQKVELLIPNRFREKHSINITNYFSSPTIRNMGSGLELFVLNKDNTELPVEVSLSPLKFHSETWVVASLRNISERRIFENRILSLNNRLRLANSTSHTGIWEYNVKTNLLIWDDIMFDLYDANQSTFTGVYNDWSSRLHPEDLGFAAGLLQDALDGIADFDTEFRVIWQDKSVHHLAAKAIIERDSSGMPIKMIGTNQDITLKKKHEELTKKIEYQNRAFIKQAPIAIAMFDTEMKYIATSSKWLSDYGLGERDIIGISHYDIFPEISDEWKKIHQECLLGEIHRKDEDKFVRADGSVQWLKWEDRPWFNIDGSIGGIIMYTEDITKQKQVAELLKISEEAFRGNFENAAIGMAILNEQGHWIKVNKKVCEIVGYTDEELKLLTFKDITHPDDLDADLNLLNQLIAGEINGYQMEKRYFHKNGSIVEIILAASMVKDAEGKILYFIAQIVDITAHKKIEKEIKHLLEISEEQNNRLKNFAHIVSHNLRSHSGNISNLVQLFIEEYSEFKDNEYINYLMSASHNLNETIANLNEVAIINTTLIDNLERIEIYDYIQKAIVNLSGLAINENVELINIVPKDTIVIGLPAYIDSVILNFISNGIKYHSEARKSFVEISAKKVGDYLILSFKDNGLGIDLKHNSNKLFGMYKTFHEHKDSRGLGLFITKNQVEAMGGKIEVESEVNIGTTFKVFLKNEEN